MTIFGFVSRFVSKQDQSEKLYEIGKLSRVRQKTRLYDGWMGEREQAGRLIEKVWER